MSGLSEDDKKLWGDITRNVRPLDTSDIPEGYFAPQRVQVETREYHPKIDLHGMTIQDAYRAVLDHISNGALLGYKRLTIVSGKSGQINVELPRWAERHVAVRSVEPFNGGGAWEIWLKRQNT